LHHQYPWITWLLRVVVVVVMTEVEAVEQVDIAHPQELRAAIPLLNRL
jgi:hypothetical protein